MYISRTKTEYSAKCDFCGIELTFITDKDLVSRNAHHNGWDWAAGYEDTTFHACDNCKHSQKYLERKIAAYKPPNKQFNDNADETGMS